jgi:predicted lysophospholipase L1 biosynthesis ABC-type transport system permease subunit
MTQETPRPITKPNGLVIKTSIATLIICMAIALLVFVTGENIMIAYVAIVYGILVLLVGIGLAYSSKEEVRPAKSASKSAPQSRG